MHHRSCAPQRATTSGHEWLQAATSGHEPPRADEWPRVDERHELTSRPRADELTSATSGPTSRPRVNWARTNSFAFYEAATKQPRAADERSRCAPTSFTSRHPENRRCATERPRACDKLCTSRDVGVPRVGTNPTTPAHEPPRGRPRSGHEPACRTALRLDSRAATRPRALTSLPRA